MRPNSSSLKTPGEKVVKNIRRAARKHYSAEDKIRVVLEGIGIDLDDIVSRSHLSCFSPDMRLSSPAWARAASLALIGAGTSLFTGRNALFSAVRQILIGLAAAGVTYGAGAIVGTSLG